MLWTSAQRLAVLTIIFALSATIPAHSASLQLVYSQPYDIGSTVDPAVSVSRVEPLAMHFSAAVAPSSVRSDTITLQSATSTPKVSLSSSGEVITVRLLGSLLPSTIYTLHATDLVGTGGETLAAPIDIRFKTMDAVWQRPQLVDRTTATQWDATTAVNEKGVRFVVWQQVGDSGNEIWAIRHTADNAAATAVRIASVGNDYISELKVSVDNDGNAFVTWVVDKSPPLPRHIWANRFVAGSGGGTGWGAPQIIDGYAARSGTNLHLAFDRVGNAFALWQEYDCCAIHSLQSIVVNRYTKTSGWSKPTHLDNSSAFLAGTIDIQTDDSGDAYATWTMLADIHYPAPKLKVSRYVSNTGWSTPQLIAVESTMNSDGRQALAVNPKGEALLMWADDTGLKFARADELGKWSTPTSIDVNVLIGPSQIVLLDSGDAFAAFRTGVKRFYPDHGWWSWTQPLLSQQDASTDPRIVVDLTGNALVVWTQNEGGIGRIYAKRYHADIGWRRAALIDTGNSLGAELQELFLDPIGNAVAAYRQNNDIGTSDVMTAQFK